MSGLSPGSALPLSGCYKPRSRASIWAEPPLPAQRPPYLSPQAFPLPSPAPTFPSSKLAFTFVLDLTVHVSSVCRVPRTFRILCFWQKIRRAQCMKTLHSGFMSHLRKRFSISRWVVAEHIAFSMSNGPQSCDGCPLGFPPGLVYPGQHTRREACHLR